MTDTMTTGTAELRALLTQARAKAGEALARDPVWLALQQHLTDGANGNGLPRATLEAQLIANPHLAIIGKIDEALALLAAATAAEAARTVPIAATPAGDDLTRIRGVKPAMAATLGRLGVTTYRQIATWTAADVRGVTAALGPDAGIHRQGWIEQAAMLAARQDAAPAPNRPATPATPATPAAIQRPAAAPAADLDHVVATALAGIIAGVPAAPTAATASSSAEASGTRPFETTAGSPRPVEALVTDRLTDVAPPPAAVTLPPPAAVPLPPPAAPRPAPWTDVRPAPPPEGDDLRLIAGLDDAMAWRLAGLGVRRFADIARWTAADVAGHEAHLDVPVRRMGWIEQAAMLAGGRMTAFAERRRSGLLACVVPAPVAAPWQRKPLRQVWQPPPAIVVEQWPRAAAVVATAAELSSLDAPVANDDALPDTADQPAAASSAPRPVPVTAAAAVLVPAHHPASIVLPEDSHESAAPQAAPTPDAIADATPPPPPPTPLPALFAPTPGTVASIMPAALSAIVAPPPPAPVPAPAPQAALHLPADRLENLGADLAPGFAAALASAAASGLALGGVPERGPRRPIADSLTTLPPLVSNINLRQWRNDMEAELGAIVDADALPDATRAPVPPAETETETEAQAEAEADDSGALALDEAEVVIVTRDDDMAPPEAPLHPVRPPADTTTTAAHIRARLRPPADDPEADPSAATSGRIEEASVEIVVRREDGSLPPPAATEPKPDAEANDKRGLSRLVRVFKGEPQGRPPKS